MQGGGATPSSCGATPLAAGAGQRPSSTTPLGAEGATPDTLPPTGRQHGLSASPPAELDRWAAGGSSLAQLSIPPPDAQGPGAGCDDRIGRAGGLSRDAVR